jgi:hypothetical protein
VSIYTCTRIYKFDFNLCKELILVMYGFSLQCTTSLSCFNHTEIEMIHTYLRNKHNQLDTHFTFTNTLLKFKVSTCFWHYLSIFRRHYTNADLVTVVDVGWSHPETNPETNPQPHVTATKSAFM